MTDHSLTRPPHTPLSGKEQNSFAFHTLTNRLPVILTKSVDSLVRANYDISDTVNVEEKRQEAKQLVNALGRIRYELQHDKLLGTVSDDGAVDVAIWNTYLQEQFPDGTWFSAPWLVSECFMYRQIHAQLEGSVHWSKHDPFLQQKQDGLQHAVKPITGLATRFGQLLIEAGTTTDESVIAELFRELILISLWGNRSDLSILPNMSTVQATHLQETHNLGGRQYYTLVDDSAALWHWVKELNNARVDIILDNTGFELFCDLLLADWLVQSGRAQKVHLHAKRIPWFVSDTTPSDLTWMLDTLLKDPAFSDAPTELSVMVSRWQEHLAHDRWQLSVDPFWTMPFAFWELPQRAPDLWKELRTSALCIYKGDLNYRKLVYDCAWPPETPFAEAIGPLSTTPGAPPVLALRTCKANVVVGLAAGQADKLDQTEPEWQTNGEFAVIQLSIPKTASS